jgi:hypothetical protein
MPARISKPPAPRDAGFTDTDKASTAARRGKRLVLQGAPAVSALRASLPYSRPAAEVSISGTSLTEDERRRWERRLTRYYPACGCTSGTVFTALTLLAGTADATRRWWADAAFPWKAVAFVVAAAALAAILGKVVGLFLGHVRMSRALRLLELRLGRS